MRQYTRIITNKILRSEEIERNLIEFHRERVIYVVMLIGALLVLYALTR